MKYSEVNSGKEVENFESYDPNSFSQQKANLDKTTINPIIGDFKQFEGNVITYDIYDVAGKKQKKSFKKFIPNEEMLENELKLKANDVELNSTDLLIENPIKPDEIDIVNQNEGNQIYNYLVNEYNKYYDFKNEKRKYSKKSCYNLKNFLFFITILLFFVTAYHLVCIKTKSSDSKILDALNNFTN